MTILVGYPTNRRAKAVLHLAGTLARSSGQDLLVCTAIHDPRIPGVARDDPEFRSYVDELASTALDNARQDIIDGVRVRFVRFDATSVSSGLIQAAETHGANMIVVGSAMGMIERITVSSVADRLLHSSPIPVAVANRGFRAGAENIRRITLAFSESEDSSAQLAAAEALAAQFGAELRLASFAVNLSPPEAQRIHFGGDEVLHQWTKNIRAAAAEAISADTATARRDPQIVIGQGDNWEDALDDIDWSAGDLLVVGSSQSGPVSRVFLGSRATKIVRHTPVPLVAIPRSAQH